MADWGTIIEALAVLGGAGLLIGVPLLVASRRRSAKAQERKAAVQALLPGTNCKDCGFPDCDGYAAAVAAGRAPLNACPVRVPNVAFLICRGGRSEAAGRSQYRRAADCRRNAPPPDGPKACSYGCVGLGRCARVCPFSAITRGEGGLPVINERKCTGCGRCVKECPPQTLRLIPQSKLVVLACVSPDRGEAVTDVCRVGCIGCNLCVEVCPTQALTMDKNLPVMDLEKCIDCAICVQKCPTRSFIDRAPGRPKALINPRCTGCQACVTVCQFRAIGGERGSQHKVAADKCIGCGECLKACPAYAIDMVGALGHVTNPA